MRSPRKTLSIGAFLLAAVMAPCSKGQQPAGNQQQSEKPHPEETMVVLGTATPVPLAESARSVEVLPLGKLTLMVTGPIDVLRSDPSIFIEQRGAGGAQADVTLRGGNFEQTLVLLNGFRINDSQTSHHNLDLPLPMEAMHSIEVLHGAGSTLHGADALAGVVDFLTAAPQTSAVVVRSGVGSFGFNEESLLGDLVRKRWSGRLTASHNLSTGFTADRDYRNETASQENWFTSRLGLTDLLGAVSDRSFGAAGFYGDYPAWERTKGWFASMRQELGPRTQAAFAYRRHTDEFVLVRENPSLYENNHIDGSWQASLRHTVPVEKNSVVLMGLEGDGDSIDSNNLGRHARNRLAGYLDLDLRPTARRWNVTAGAREEGFSGGNTAFAPHLAGSYRVTDKLKLRAAGGYGYRIPTYTDLYYTDPVDIPNPKLKPESAWSGEGGFDWNAGAKLALSATGFYSRQHDAIDYVRAAESDPWQAVNLNGLSYAGVEASATWTPARNQTIQLGLTALHGAQAALHGLQSEYVFNYPVENAHAEWSAALGKWLTMRNTVQVAQRYQETPYPVWNLALTYDPGPDDAAMHPWSHPGLYLRLENLSNTGYQEILGVAMPGRSITGGLVFHLGQR